MDRETLKAQIEELEARISWLEKQRVVQALQQSKQAASFAAQLKKLQDDLKAAG